MALVTADGTVAWASVLAVHVFASSAVLVLVDGTVLRVIPFLTGGEACVERAWQSNSPLSMKAHILRYDAL